MPVDHTLKNYSCDYPSCIKAFIRRSDMKRHRQIHCTYEERRFACPSEGCGFRANQHGGLICHIKSKHENVRLPCGEPGCEKTYADPSSRSKHRQKFHREQVEYNAPRMGCGYRTESHSRAPSSYHPPGHNIWPSGSDVASSSSTRRCTTRPSPYERHRANDVQSDNWSAEPNNQIEHQAYDANAKAASMACGSPNTRTLPGIRELTFDGPSASQRQTGDSSSVEDPLRLAPLREDWMWQSVAPAFSMTTGRPLSDHGSSSSAYPHPDPSILFHSTRGTSFNR